MDWQPIGKLFVILAIVLLAVFVAAFLATRSPPGPAHPPQMLPPSGQVPANPPE